MGEVSSMDISYAFIGSLSLKAANEQRNNQNDHHKDCGNSCCVTDAVGGKGGTINQEACNHRKSSQPTPGGGIDQIKDSQGCDDGGHQGYDNLRTEPCNRDVNELLKSVGAIKAGGFVMLFLDMLHPCQERPHTEAVLHPGSDTAHCRQSPSEIAQSTDGENIQANLLEKCVDGPKGGVEHPTPDHTDDNHTDDLGQKKYGTEEGKSRNGALAQERDQKEPYQD